MKVYERRCLIDKMNASPWQTLAVWFWSNIFIGWSRLFGVPKTIRAINYIAHRLPLENGRIEMISHAFDRGYRHVRGVFLGRKQRCLLRGFLLYFYGKRMNLNIKLLFGSRLDKGDFHTHCWISCNNILLFENENVIRQFVVLVEYT